MMNRRLIFEMEFFTMYSRTYIVSPTRFHEKELQAQPPFEFREECLCVSHASFTPSTRRLGVLHISVSLIDHLPIYPNKNNHATKNTMHAYKTSKPSFSKHTNPTPHTTQSTERQTEKENLTTPPTHHPPHSP